MPVRSAGPLALGLALAMALHVGLLPATAALTSAGDFYSKIVVDIGIAIILAVSLTIVNGFTGQFSIGHAGFMAVGGYVAAAITYYGSVRIFGDAQPRGGWLSWGLGMDSFPGGGMLGPGDALFVASCLAGGLVAAGAGYVVGLPSLRLRGDYLAIVTLGFGEIVRVLLQSSRDQVIDPQMIRDTPALELSTHLGKAVGFNFVPTYTTLFWTYLWVAITLYVALRLKRSSYGRAFLSIREDEIAAEGMGIRTTRYKVAAFVIAAFFAGVAGALFAHQIGSINAGELGFMKSFDVVIIVVLGGLGSVSGAVLAAIILTVLPEVLRDAAQYRMIVYALLLIVMMIVRPQGLLGVREVWELRRGGRHPADAPPSAPRAGSGSP
jgi:branched-chain amino acid transport system permease protein